MRTINAIYLIPYWQPQHPFNQAQGAKYDKYDKIDVGLVDR